MFSLNFWGTGRSQLVFSFLAANRFRLTLLSNTDVFESNQWRSI